MEINWKKVIKEKKIIGRFSILKDIKNQKGKKLVSDILNRFSKEFVISNFYLRKYSGLNAHSNNEKQLHSVLFPALNQSVDACIFEFPIKKSSRSKTGNGYIDYLLVKNKPNRNFILLEIKHNKIWSDENKKRQLSDKWENLITQIKSLSGDTISTFRRSGKVYKIGLMVCPINHRYIMGESDKINYENQYKKLLKILIPKPNWISIIDYSCSLYNQDYYFTFFVFGYVKIDLKN